MVFKAFAPRRRGTGQFSASPMSSVTSLAGTATPTSFQTASVSEPRRPSPPPTLASVFDPPDSSTRMDVSSSAYAQRCRDLMKLHRELSDLGQGMDLRLPRLTVIGSQSAGKSSLVEAVSGISVPRDSNTCTRCPMALSMTSSDGASWSCNISLRRMGPYESVDNSPRSDEPFTIGLTNPADVELWLRRAQAAILSPHRPSSEFHALSADQIKASTDSRALEFSQDTVVVQLNNPEATDLSFVDLPGLIQNHDDAGMIERVRSVVQGQISGDNNLVLVTIPMSDDMENQPAVMLARKEDPNGYRTIGVLTKPDTVGSGDLGKMDLWKNVLTGQAHPLRLGYYCVRMMNDEQRKNRASGTNLDDFFTTVAPWKDIQPRSTFGIPNFVSGISKLLVEMIEANLPVMRSRAAKLLAEKSAALAQLPPRPRNNATTEVILLITRYCDQISNAVKGTEHKDLVHSSRGHYDRYKRCIQATCPDFRPFVDGSVYSDPGLRESSGGGVENPYADASYDYISDETEPIDLSRVREVITSSVTWELPGNVPFDATKVLLQNITRLWERPTTECFDNVSSTTASFVSNLSNDHFSQYHVLRSLANKITERQLNIRNEATSQFLSQILTLESTPLYTQDYQRYKSETDFWSNKYTKVAEYPGSYLLPSPVSSRASHASEDISEGYMPWPQAASVHHANLAQNNGWGSPSISVPKASVKVVEVRVPVDPKAVQYARELHLMATVRAYYQVSYKRLVDYVPLAIEHTLLHPLADAIREALIQSVVGDRSVKMEDLLAEDPAISSRRRTLEDEVRRLREIQVKLNALMASTRTR